MGTIRVDYFTRSPYLPRAEFSGCLAPPGENMRNFFIAIVLTFSCAAHSIAAKPAVGAPLKPVYCQIRLLEGKPDGSEAQGTLKVLAEPILVTTETREGVFVAGGEMDVPGTDEKLPFGTNLQITPGKFDGDVIFARLSLEVFQIAKLEDKSFTASTGNVVRAVGTFTCGKPARPRGGLEDFSGEWKKLGTELGRLGGGLIDFPAWTERPRGRRQDSGAGLGCSSSEAVHANSGPLEVLHDRVADDPAELGLHGAEKRLDFLPRSLAVEAPLL